jgi:hypothetical protein
MFLLSLVQHLINFTGFHHQHAHVPFPYMLLIRQCLCEVNTSYFNRPLSLVNHTTISLRFIYPLPYYVPRCKPGLRSDDHFPNVCVTYSLCLTPNTYPVSCRCRLVLGSIIGFTCTVTSLQAHTPNCYVNLHLHPPSLSKSLEPTLMVLRRPLSTGTCTTPSFIAATTPPLLTPFFPNPSSARSHPSQPALPYMNFPRCCQLHGNVHKQDLKRVCSAYSQDNQPHLISFDISTMSSGGTRCCCLP